MNIRTKRNEDAPTTDRLRHDIDQGGADDKVPFADPAAAPLGTDEEAAGTPPAPAAIRQAHRQEVTGDSLPSPAVTEERTRTISGENRSRWQTPAIVIMLVIVALAVVAAVLASLGIL